MSNSFDISKFNFSESDARKDIVMLAHASENAERYDDMCKFMKSLVQTVGTSSDLTIEERNLLSVAYKNVIGSRRASWRTLNVAENGDSDLVKTYRQIVESELDAICQEVLSLLHNFLIPNSQNNSDESQVFYLKMTGDYYRYLAEFVKDQQYDTKAAEHYEKAMNLASEKLPATHPIRLGLALNYSVCFYEIINDPKKACDLAKKAFDDAISKLDQLDEASYKDSTLIMQLLRDNLSLWQNPETEEQQD